MYAIPTVCPVNENECLALLKSHCHWSGPQAVASPRLVNLSDHWPFFLSSLPSSHGLLASAASLLIQTLVILWNPHEHLGWACPASVAFGSFCVLLYHPPSSLLFACHTQLAQWSNKSATLYFSLESGQISVSRLSMEKFIISVCISTDDSVYSALSLEINALLGVDSSNENQSETIDIFEIEWLGLSHAYNKKQRFKRIRTNSWEAVRKECGNRKWKTKGIRGTEWNVPRSYSQTLLLEVFCTGKNSDNSRSLSGSWRVSERLQPNDVPTLRRMHNRH